MGLFASIPTKTAAFLLLILLSACPRTELQPLDLSKFDQQKAQDGGSTDGSANGTSEGGTEGSGEDAGNADGTGEGSTEGSSEDAGVGDGTGDGATCSVCTVCCTLGASASPDN